jgi:hypothetical protein
MGVAVSQPAFAPIPTVYQGVRFRSRTEARWAAFFDAINLPWQYEPEGFERDGIRYLPDFWLPKVFNRGRDQGGCYFEVKPAAPTAHELAKARMIASGTGRFVILAASSPITTADEYLHEIVRTPDQDWDDEGLRFGVCDFCDRVSIDFYASDEPHCICRMGSLSADHGRVVVARRNFQNFARWEG